MGAERAGETQRGFLVAGDDLRGDAQARFNAGGEFREVVRVARSRSCDHPHAYRTGLADHFGVILDRGEGAGQGCGREVVGAVHAFAQADDAHLAHHVRGSSVEGDVTD